MSQQNDNQNKSPVQEQEPVVQANAGAEAGNAATPAGKPAAAPQTGKTAAAPQAGAKRVSANPAAAKRPAQARSPQKSAKKKPAKRTGKRAAGTIKSLFGAVNKKFDVFRKDEATTILTNTLLRGAGVILVLCVFFLMKPGIDSLRAGMFARSGNADKATKIVNALERREYPEDKLNRLRIKVARNLIEAGQQEWVTALIAEIPSGVEKASLEQAQTYARAQALYEAADYTGAAQMFYQLGEYRDAGARYADSRCVIAIQAWQAGNEDSARSLLLGVSDVVTHVSNAARDITGDESAAREILGSDLFDEANLAEMERVMAELTAARSEMPEGRIAAGWDHTVILNADGTVRAVGDNSKGQCNVTGWTGIARVAAGAYHTVGLRSDGTVVAAGNNTMGQCNVTGWTDIVAVAAGTADTIGLKSDGTVVAAGQHADKVSGWRGITFVTAGSYAMGAISENGSMLSSHKGAQMDMGVSLYDLSVCGPVSVGVLYDGSLVSSFEGAPRWDNIVTATACESGILAIDVDGKVRTHFYNAGSNVDISVPGKAVAIESSGTHHVVLTEEGGVYAFGNNDFGQCNVN